MSNNNHWDSTSDLFNQNNNQQQNNSQQQNNNNSNNNNGNNQNNMTRGISQFFNNDTNSLGLEFPRVDSFSFYRSPTNVLGNNISSLNSNTTNDQLGTQYFSALLDTNNTSNNEQLNKQQMQMMQSLGVSVPSTSLSIQNSTLTNDPFNSNNNNNNNNNSAFQQIQNLETMFNINNNNNNNNNNQLHNPYLNVQYSTTTTTTTTITNNNNNKINANTYDDDEELNTPPTPAAENWDSPGIYRQPTTSFSSVNNDYEAEQPSKYQRVLSENSLNQKLSADPHYQLNFLRDQTTKLNSTSTDDLTRSKSFQINHYQTGVEQISMEYYNNLLMRYNTRPESFERAKEKQIQVINGNNIQYAAELQTLYTTMKKDIDEENNELKNLLCKKILEPTDLKRITETIEGLKSHLRVVEVLYNELKYIINRKKPECCAALIITQQPCSQVIFRGGKGMADIFKVQMIFGVLQPDNISPISAVINKSEVPTVNNKKDKSQQLPTLENAESSLNTQTWEAEFKNVKVNISTRMTPSSLRFVATYKEKTSGKTVEKQVESVPSNPLIVITNESQWAEAAGKLLMSDAFTTKDEIPWEYFANILHIHILTSTHQSNEIKRKLHSWEFDYIQKNYFDNKPTVSRTECKSFWDKFGPILQAIHFKRHIEPLWSSGLIYGLITKAECNSYLNDLPEGSFLIRFSDSVPGSFAVAYVTNDEAEPVKHYLVKPEDIGANKTLPDFLRERHQFKTLYQVDPSKRSLHPKNKDSELEPYYSKRIKSTANANPGYVSGL